MVLRHSAMLFLEFGALEHADPSVGRVSFIILDKEKILRNMAKPFSCRSS
jgi:hypothetical protein